MIECMDTGRALHEFDLDYQLAIYQFRYFAGAVLTHYDGESRPVQNGYLMTKKEPLGVVGQIIPWNVPMRSEEHTSELQSRGRLVCRLLLEKKIRTGELGDDHPEAAGPGTELLRGRSR